MSEQQPEATGGSARPDQQGHFSARVPEKVARGVYSSGQVVIESQKEILMDFLMGITRPFSVVARVILVPQTLSEFITAFEQNLNSYIERYGQPHAPTPPPQERKPTLEEIYEHFKLADEMLSGTYAQAVLIGHSPTEFVLDFLTNFYPTPAVGARIYLPAGHAPRFLGTLKSTLQRYHQRFGKKEEPGTSL
ncbi:MAG TPA: DUF3467 domain-containing protein [Tepidisphaeraceae bacterium]|jgi:hypothetical protein